MPNWNHLKRLDSCLVQSVINLQFKTTIICTPENLHTFKNVSRLKMYFSEKQVELALGGLFLFLFLAQKQRWTVFTLIFLSFFIFGCLFSQENFLDLLKSWETFPFIKRRTNQAANSVFRPDLFHPHHHSCAFQSFIFMHTHLVCMSSDLRSHITTQQDNNLKK